MTHICAKPYSTPSGQYGNHFGGQRTGGSQPTGRGFQPIGGSSQPANKVSQPAGRGGGGCAPATLVAPS